MSMLIDFISIPATGPQSQTIKATERIVVYWLHFKSSIGSTAKKNKSGKPYSFLIHFTSTPASGTQQEKIENIRHMQFVWIRLFFEASAACRENFRYLYSLLHGSWGWKYWKSDPLKIDIFYWRLHDSRGWIYLKYFKNRYFHNLCMIPEAKNAVNPISIDVVYQLLLRDSRNWEYRRSFKKLYLYSLLCDSRGWKYIGIPL